MGLFEPFLAHGVQGYGGLGYRPGSQTILLGGVHFKHPTPKYPKTRFAEVWVFGAPPQNPRNNFANWEPQMSHNDVYLFSRIDYNATGKRTRSKNVDVKGTKVKVLSHLVAMVSASGCTTLFVHACTINVQFE